MSDTEQSPRVADGATWTDGPPQALAEGGVVALPSHGLLWPGGELVDDQDGGEEDRPEDEVARLRSLCEEAADEIERCPGEHSQALFRRLSGLRGGGYTGPAVREGLRALEAKLAAALARPTDAPALAAWGQRMAERGDRAEGERDRAVEDAVRATAALAVERAGRAADREVHARERAAAVQDAQVTVARLVRELADARDEAGQLRLTIEGMEAAAREAATEHAVVRAERDRLLGDPTERDLRDVRRRLRERGDDLATTRTQVGKLQTSLREATGLAVEGEKALRLASRVAALLVHRCENEVRIPVEEVQAGLPRGMQLSQDWVQEDGKVVALLLRVCRVREVGEGTAKEDASDNVCDGATAPGGQAGGESTAGGTHDDCDGEARR